jgi:cytochrome P450
VRIYLHTADKLTNFTAFTMYLLPAVVLASLGLFAAYHLLSHLYSLFFSPLRNIPGPLSARFSRLYYFAHVYGGHWEHRNIKLHRQYKAPVVRVAPNWYSISDPSALKTIYGPGSKFEKSAWFEGWKHPSPKEYSLFTFRSNEVHARERKKFQSMYSMSALVSYEKYVDECASILAERLREFAKSGARIDMSHWLNCYAFDVIGDITYSQRFGFLDKGEDVNGIMRALEVQMPYATLVGIYPRWHPTLFSIMSRFSSSGARGRTYLMNFSRRMLKDRQELESVRVRGDISKDIESLADDEIDLPTDLLQKFLNDLYGGKEGWKMDDVFKVSSVVLPGITCTDKCPDVFI